MDCTETGLIRNSAEKGGGGRGRGSWEATVKGGRNQKTAYWNV